MKIHIIGFKNDDYGIRTDIVVSDCDNNILLEVGQSRTIISKSEFARLLAAGYALLLEKE